MPKTPRYEVRVRVTAPINPALPIGLNNRMDVVDLLLRTTDEWLDAEEYQLACLRMGRPPTFDVAYVPAKAVMEAVVAMSATPTLLVQEYCIRVV